MEIVNKTEILNNLCYSDLVYERINMKLRLHLSKTEIETLLHSVVRETSEHFFERKGKNVYVTNHEKNIKVTINSNTFRVITVDLLVKHPN